MSTTIKKVFNELFDDPNICFVPYDRSWEYNITGMLDEQLVPNPAPGVIVKTEDRRRNMKYLFVGSRFGTFICFLASDNSDRLLYQIPMKIPHQTRVYINTMMISKRKDYAVFIVGNRAGEQNIGQHLEQLVSDTHMTAITV